MLKLTERRLDTLLQSSHKRPIGKIRRCFPTLFACLSSPAVHQHWITPCRVGSLGSLDLEELRIERLGYKHQNEG